MKGILKNGIFSPAPRFIQLEDGRTISNPNDEILESFGYKEVILADEENQENLNYQVEWEETETTIIQKLVEIEIIQDI